VIDSRCPGACSRCQLGRSTHATLPPKEYAQRFIRIIALRPPPQPPHRYLSCGCAKLLHYMLTMGAADDSLGGFFLPQPGEALLIALIGCKRLWSGDAICYTFRMSSHLRLQSRIFFGPNSLADDYVHVYWVPCPPPECVCCYRSAAPLRSTPAAPPKQNRIRYHRRLHGRRL